MTASIAPFLGAFFRRRVRSGKENADRIHERFAKYVDVKATTKLIWFHAASVGESQLLLEMARRLAKQGLSDTTLLFTCQTETASDLITKALKADPDLQAVETAHKMAPVDTRGVTRRFLDHWQPTLVIFSEGEIWPNQLLELEARQPKGGYLLVIICLRQFSLAKKPTKFFKAKTQRWLRLIKTEGSTTCFNALLPAG